MRLPARVPCSARLLCSAAVVLAMAACGDSATGPTTSPTPTPPRHPAVFPLTITRIGGIAGFQDTLVVAGDGLVSVKHKGQQSQCRLTPQAVGRLTTAASQVPWPRITPGATQPSFPDDLVSTVQSPAGGPVRLEDPGLGAGGQVFQALLNDLNGSRSRSLMCLPL